MQPLTVGGDATGNADFLSMYKPDVSEAGGDATESEIAVNINDPIVYFWSRSWKNIMTRTMICYLMSVGIVLLMLLKLPKRLLRPLSSKRM